MIDIVSPKSGFASGSPVCRAVRGGESQFDKPSGSTDRCIIFLLPPEKRDDVRKALAAVPGRVLEAVPVAHGLTIDRTDIAQAAFFFGRGRHIPRRSDTIEQLYAWGGRGDYRGRPWDGRAEVWIILARRQ